MLHPRFLKAPSALLVLAMTLLAVPVLPAAAVPSATAVLPTGDLRGVSFVDGNTGWVVGANDGVYKTTNGGLTWAKQTQAQITGYANIAVSFANTSAGIVVSGERPETEWTSDGGADWSASEIAGDWSGHPEEVAARDVVMTSPATGFVVGSGSFGMGVVFKTTNGGVSWEPKLHASVWSVIEDVAGEPTLVDHYARTDFNGADFDGASQGWVVGDRLDPAPDAAAGPAIYYTPDGGSSFTTETAPATVTAGLYSVSANGGGTAVAVGESGTILKRSAAGAWSSKTSGTTALLYDVAFWGDGTHGVAVGAGGTVVRTSDAGEKWTKLSQVPTYQQLNSVSVTASGRGWAVGNGGVVLRTSDFGATWANATDTTDPVTTSDITAGWKTTPVTVTLDAQDYPRDSYNPTGTGIQATYYSVDGDSSDASGNPTKPYAGPFSITADGAHTVKYYSVDGAGNVEAVHQQTVSVDKTKPVTTVVGAQSSYPDTTTVLSLSPVDPASGIAETFYSVDGGTEQTGTAVTVTGLGAHYIEYHSVDKAGNVESTHRFDFEISPLAPPDTTPPTTTSNIPSGWVNEDFRVVLSPVDTGGSGVKATYYSTNGAAPTSLYPVDGFIVSNEGATTIKYYSVDNKDNLETPVKSQTLKIDKAAPVTTSNAAAYYDGPATVTLVSSDKLGNGAAGSGVVNTTYRLDGALEESGTTVTVSGVGAHSLEWWSTDRAGNREATHQVSFNIREATTVASTTGATTRVVSYGSSFRLQGSLKDSLGQPLPSKPVLLESSSSGTGSWTRAATLTSASNGSFAIYVRPYGRTYYRFRFAGDTAYKPAQATSNNVYPRAYVGTPATPSTVYVRRYFTTSGYLKPRHTAGASSVKLQFYLYTGGKYVLKKTVYAKNANYYSYTRYSISTYLTYRGKWRVRAFHGDAGHYATYSAYRYLTVK